MKIAAGPFKPSTKDLFTVLESSVDSDPSWGLHRQGKCSLRSSRPTAEDCLSFSPRKQPVDSPRNQVLQTEHLSDKRAELQGILPQSHLSHPLAPHSWQRAVTCMILFELQTTLQGNKGKKSVSTFYWWGNWVQEMTQPWAPDSQDSLSHWADCHFLRDTSRKTEIRRTEEQGPWSTLLLRKARREVVWKQLTMSFSYLGLHSWPTVHVCRSAGPAWRESWGWWTSGPGLCRQGPWQPGDSLATTQEAALAGRRNPDRGTISNGGPLSLVAQRVKSLPVMQETQVQSLGKEGPLEEEMATHCSTLAWRIPMDRGAWQATVHGGHKELDMTERLHFHFLSLFFLALEMILSPITISWGPPEKRKVLILWAYWSLFFKVQLVEP